MIRFVNFTKELIPQAIKILEHNYQEERKEVPALPKEIDLPDLDKFTDTGRGFAIVGDQRLFGFLCILPPWQDPFDRSGRLSSFSPLHAHGAVTEYRDRIYQDLFEAASKEWTNQGIERFAVSFFAHDEKSKLGLFEYGFGMHAKDALARINDLQTTCNKECILKHSADLKPVFSELPLKDFPLIQELRIALNRHLQEAPCFMRSSEVEMNKWLDRVEKGDRRTFIAKIGQEVIAYLDIGEKGENFVTLHPAMMNIQGAYCIPEYRGKGLFTALLGYTAKILSNEGYYYMGVDYESTNPAAVRYWKKYFTPYTNSLVRKIERVEESDDFIK